MCAKVAQLRRDTIRDALQAQAEHELGFNEDAENTAFDQLPVQYQATQDAMAFEKKLFPVNEQTLLNSADPTSSAVGGSNHLSPVAATGASQKPLPQGRASTVPSGPACGQEKVLVVIATGWGSAYGGINAFSLDFSFALGRVLGETARVICLTRDVDNLTQIKIEKLGVKILTLDEINSENALHAARKAHDLLRNTGINAVELIIGHDVFTGPVAVELAALLGSHAAVIHHMSYARYQAVKADGESAGEKEKQQRQVLCRANYVLAVGPLLRDSAEELCDRQIPMIVPGLAEIEPIEVRKNSFRAIAFGRLGGADDRIKQSRLAVAGYGRFVRLAHNKLNRTYRLNLFGLPPEQYSREDAKFQAIAKKEADRVVNVVARQYTESRDELFEALKQNDVAMMLSWHEGFGLVGWEAIAAGVPLVVSKASGLYKLIAEMNGNFVDAVDIRGSTEEEPDDRDVESVAEALFRIAGELPAAITRAKTLRERLRGQYTWDGCALEALAACGWTVCPAGQACPAPAVPPERDDRGTTGPTDAVQKVPDKASVKKPDRNEIGTISEGGEVDTLSELDNTGRKSVPARALRLRLFSRKLLQWIIGLLALLVCVFFYKIQLNSSPMKVEEVDDVNNIIVLRNVSNDEINLIGWSLERHRDGFDEVQSWKCQDNTKLTANKCVIIRCKPSGASKVSMKNKYHDAEEVDNTEFAFKAGDRLSLIDKAGNLRIGFAVP